LWVLTTQNKYIKIVFITCEKNLISFCRVYCLIGDGESAEGSIWEALQFGSHYKQDNLCVVIDVNRLGQSEPTSLQHNMDVYRKRLDSFGWNAIVVDGHDVEELCKVMHLHACLIRFQQITFFIKLQDMGVTTKCV
jgi:transketolase N-terminal domain/subunit